MVIVLNAYLIQKFVTSVLALKKCLYAENPVYLGSFFLTTAVHLIKDIVSTQQPCPIISSLRQNKASSIYCSCDWYIQNHGGWEWDKATVYDSWETALQSVLIGLGNESHVKPPFRVVVLNTHSKNTSLISRRGNIIPNTYIVSRSIASFPSTSTFQIPSNTPAKDSLKMEMVFTFKQHIWSQNAFYC